jgi:tetratricopeptide (TPR) repeat protein
LVLDGHNQRGEVKVVDVFEQTGRRIDTELKDEPEIRAELHHTVGTTYQALGQYDTARTHFRASLDAYRALYGERHAKVAEALYYLGASETSRNSAAANALFRQSLELFREVDPNNTNVAYLMHDFAATLLGAGETAAAEQTAREGLELSRQKYGEEHLLTCAFLSILGRVYEYRGDLGQAETSYQTVLAIARRIPEAQPSELMEHLGHISFHKGDFKQAEAQYREALDISRRTRNETHPMNAHFMLRLAEAHHAQGAYADAEKEAASALDLLRRIGAGESSYRLRGLSLLCLSHVKTNRPNSAAAFLREALTVFDNLSDEEKYGDEGLLGEALIATGRKAEAGALLLKRHAFFARTYGEQNPEALHTRQLLELLDASTVIP